MRRGHRSLVGRSGAGLERAAASRHLLMTRHGQPERTCIACGKKAPQGTFLRLAALGGQNPVVDGSRRQAGRGAYLCRSSKCVETALTKRALMRALRLKQGPAPHFGDEMRRAVLENETTGA